MSVVNIETNQGAFMTTGRVEGNEIVKEEDFTFSFQSLIGNISKFSRMIFEAEKDFVIGGKVTVDTGTNVKIAPVFGVCMSTGTPFGIAEELQGFSIAVEQGGTDRIDILEVRGVYQDFDQQQRAFNDLDNDTITYQTINTKTGMSIEVVVKKGTAGAAPSVTPGWVKLCEIHYTANATDLSDDDIKNITADISTLDNDDWTTDVDCVYNIGYISDVNERFRVQHNEDGTHADDCINSDSLDIGTGAKQVNGSVLPIGGSVTIPGQTTQITDSIVSTMTKLATVITSLYNAYLKYGTYGINGELKISSLADGNNDLTKPISVYAAGDGTAVIKIDGSAVLSIDANGRLSTNGYTPNSNNNLVTQAVTSAIAGDLATLTAYVNSLAPQLDQSTYTNGTLSSGTGGRFNLYTSVEITRASTENIASLSGIASIDGSEPTNGDLILLKDQTDKTKNGIWTYNNTGDWNRPSVSPSDFSAPENLKGLLFNIKGGTANAGKMFYMPKVSFTDSASFGTDDIEFLEYFGSVAPHENKVAMRDSSGHVKTANSASSKDAINRGELLNLIYPIGSTYTQYPNTSDPNVLWGWGSTWQNISSDYANAFFRAEGDGTVAQAFANQTNPQDDATAVNGLKVNSTNNLTGKVGRWIGLNYFSDEGILTKCDGQKNLNWIAYLGGAAPYAAYYNLSGIEASGVQINANHNHSLSGDTETRPMNYTVRIWKRIA